MMIIFIAIDPVELQPASFASRRPAL